MTESEIRKLVQLREFVIHQHKMLDGKGAPTTALMKQKDVASVYESLVRSIDDLLREQPGVEFK